MKTENRNENSLLAPITFLPFFFIACCTLPSSADMPSFYTAYDCSPSDSSYDAGFPDSKRYKFDFSSVSRVYAIDPSNREKPRISACFFRKQITLPFSVSDGPKFLRLYFKPVTYSGLDVSKALFSISVDVFSWSHGAGIPIYRDYVVNFSSYGEGVKYLSIALGSTDGSYAKYGSPILNGLEIFKLSDFSNNLAGPHPFGVIVSPHPHFSVRDAESYDVVIVARVFTGLLLAFCAIGFLGYSCLFSSRSNGQKKSSKEDQSLGYCRIFTIAETKSATNNFADGLLIGTGGFGTVYKGSIDELAMQQQEGVGQQEVSRVQKEANGTMNGDLRIMIDKQRCSGFDISDPNPGVEFSDIMVPTGR
ncbi:hypothetical protein D5086_020126 [Populus alba]|uniref:Uncharacterized protein n=1 Tax=Populus alba TaxID=43335 RepID=A0ACC4BJ57_POPAL